MATREDVKRNLCKATDLLSTDPREAKRIVEDLLASSEDMPELHSRVLTTLGQARKSCGDREGAAWAYRKAIEIEPSALERGHIFSRFSILEVENHRYHEALDKACRGMALIEQAEPTARDLAQGLIARGMAHVYSRQFLEAERDVRRSLELIHPKKDSRLYHAALHNLSRVLLLGNRSPARIKEGLKLLDASNKLLRRFRVPLKSVQNGTLLWAKGLAFRMTGCDERGEALLQRAAKILFEIGAHTDWIHVSFDLIDIYIHRTRWGMVKMTVAQLLPHVNDAETIAVLKTLHSAIRSDTITVAEEILDGVYRHVSRGKYRSLQPSKPAQADTSPGW